VASLLDGKVVHEWGDHLRLYYEGGVIKKGEEKNIDVVGEQQIPRDGDTAECAIMVLGEYACSKKNGEYEGNQTTRAIQREVGLCLGDVLKESQKPYVVWVDMCKISARETNAGINERKIGPILGQNVSLQDEFFGRFQASLRILTSIEAYAHVNRYPVIVIAGDQVKENAFVKWRSRGYLRIVNTIYESDSFQVLLVAVKMINDDGNEYEQSVVFIAGGEHPSAHLRQAKESVAKFKMLCSLEAAAIRYARFDAAGKTFDEFLDASAKQRLEVRKKRKEKFLELFRESHHRHLVRVVRIDDDSSSYTKDYAHLRLVELENGEVAENFEWFLKENDPEFVLKCLKLVSFAKGLGRSESSTKFRKSLTTLKGNSALIKKIANALSSDSFYAALAVKGEAYLDDLAKARESGAFKDNDSAYAKAMGSDSFHSAFSKKGEAYLDALAKARESGAFKDNDSAYANALSSSSFHFAFSKKGEAYLDALAKARESGAFKDNDSAYANAMGLNSFHSAFSKKGEAYLDALAKVRASPKYKDNDAEYAKAMGLNSFHSAYARNGDAFLKEREGAEAAGVFVRNPDAKERAQKSGSFNAAVKKLGGDKFKERIDNLVLTSEAFGGINEKLLAKVMGLNSFFSAIANADEKVVCSFLAKLNSAKKELTINGDASLFEAAMTNGSFFACISNKNGCDDFINLLGRMIKSPAFVDNVQAQKNALRSVAVIVALFKHGEGFLTALENVQRKSYRDKKTFAAQLGRSVKKKGTTCRAFVDGILLRLPQPPQQQNQQREEKKQQQEHREVQNRFASGTKRKRAEDDEASARIDEAQQLPLAQTVPQQQMQQQQHQQQLVQGNRVKILGDIPSEQENFGGLTPQQINTRRKKLKGEKGEIIEIVNRPDKHTRYIVKLDNTIRVSGKALPKTISVLASNLILSNE